MAGDLKVFDELKAEVEIFVAPTMAVKVTDESTAREAVHAAKTVKLLAIKLDKKRTELVKPLNDRVKQINSYAKSIDDPLARAEKHLKAQLAAWEDEQARIREQKLREEQRLRDEEERKAREEQARIEAEIEAKRKADHESLAERAEIAKRAAALFGDDDDEPAADLEAERRRIEETAERERLESEARLERERRERENEAKGRAWDIEQQGVKNAKKVWDFEVEDLSLVPREFLKIEVNRAAVLAAARGGVTSIPGLKVFQKTTVAIGANTYIPELATIGEKSDG